MVEIFGASRAAFVGRELTKMHEQCVAGTLDELRAMVEEGAIASRGEFVIVVAGSDDTAAGEVAVDPDRLLAELAGAMPGRQAADIVARLTGRGRNEVYKRMLALREERGEN